MAVFLGSCLVFRQSKTVGIALILGVSLAVYLRREWAKGQQSGFFIVIFPWIVMPLLFLVTALTVVVAIIRGIVRLVRHLAG